MSPSGVEIVEVSPRDGLQDESSVVATDAKIELVRRAIDAGIRRVEAVSFVHPRRVPQMADAEAVVAGVGDPGDATLVGLVLNERGFERAAACGVGEVNAVVVVTDTFSVRNQGVTTEQALDAWEAIAARAHDAGIRATVTLSAAFGCPYEGVVDAGRVRSIAHRASAGGPAEIVLADTIGSAVPTEVSALVRAVGDDVGLPVRVHLHNSRNAGFANAVAAIEAGVVALDASLGGMGGCPFAPGASGNIATEDLAWMLERMGVGTGVRVDRLIDASTWLAGVVGRELPGQVARAGEFPRA